MGGGVITMKNTHKLTMSGTGWIRTANLSFDTSALTMLLSELPSRKPSVPLAPYAPPGHSSYPHRLNGVPLAGRYEQIQSYMLYGRYHCRFLLFNAFVVRGSLPGYGDWTPPAFGRLDLSTSQTSHGARDSSLLLWSLPDGYPANTKSATPMCPSHRSTGHLLCHGIS